MWEVFSSTRNSICLLALHDEEDNLRPSRSVREGQVTHKTGTYFTSDPLAFASSVLPGEMTFLGKGQQTLQPSSDRAEASLPRGHLGGQRHDRPVSLLPGLARSHQRRTDEQGLQWRYAGASVVAGRCRSSPVACREDSQANLHTRDDGRREGRAAETP